jgi:hypothetical protein
MMRRSMPGTAVLLLVAVVLALVACDVELVKTVERREPFSSQRESENGIMVRWSGDTTGHEPGEQTTVDTRFANNSEEIWAVRFCLQLLNRQASDVEIIGLEEREFHLDPGVGQSSEVTFQVPAGLEPGAYGLALVVHRPGGPMVDVVAIRVGTADAAFGPVTSEETDSALAACLAGGTQESRLPARASR